MDEVKMYSVLIVDDERLNIQTLTQILGSDYTIYVERNGRQTIKTAEELLPDVILLDIIMPEMDGYEAIKVLKSSERTKDIPVIFISGLRDPDSEEKGLALGAADYITKPFSPAVVKFRVENQIKILEKRMTDYDLMKYRLTGNALNIALWDMDVVAADPVNPSNSFTWSPEFRRMLGFSGELDFPNVLNSWSDRLHPEDKERTLEAFAAHMNDYTGKTPYNLEYRLMLKNGEYRHFHGFGDTLRDSGGIPIKTAGAIVDITERKVMEQELEQRTSALELQTTTLQTMINAAPDFVFCKDLDSKYTMLNKSCADFFGIDPDSVIGKGDMDGFNFPAEVAGQMIAQDKKVFAYGLKTVDENWLTISEDSSRYLQTIKAPLIQDGAIIGLIGIARDITDIQRLAKERAEADIANRAKSSFLANMSHEIRTPMNTILGVTEIMLQDETLPDEIVNGLDKIHTACDLLLGIINDILDFSKIEAGKLDILPAEYELASLINDTVHMNMMRIGGRPIEFELHISENTPAKMIGEELRIKQILNNILSNAFKYTDAGKVTLSVASEPDEKGALLVLSVRDTGQGMTKEQVAKLFDEYSRFNENANRTVEGIGLGMAITQSLIKLMNGSIHVESEPGTGSLFIIRLPQETVGGETISMELIESLQQLRYNLSERKRKGNIVREPMPYGSVLVVDDVETNLYVAIGLMKFYKLKTETVMSGRDAINRIKSGNEYDVVFMDHMMPGMDGIETTKHLRASGYTGPIVALTANAVAGQADMFLSNGFDAFISKPIDVRQLNNVLNKFIRDKQPPEVIEAARRQADSAEQGPGDEQAQIDLLMMKSFVRDARKAVAVLEELRQNAGFADDASLQRFIITVHGIKSALGNIGDSALSEAAAVLEQAGREQDIELITSSADIFLDALRALLEMLESKLTDDSAGEEEDLGDLRDKLLAIQEKCAACNRKGALDILSTIKSGSNETKAVVDNIMEYVLQGEYEEAENAVTAYIAALPPTS